MFLADMMELFDVLRVQMFVMFVFVLYCVRLSDFVVPSTFFNINFRVLPFLKLPYLPFKTCAVKFKD